MCLDAQKGMTSITGIKNLDHLPYRQHSLELLLHTQKIKKDNMTENHKVALITGITGQDGAYLAELLLTKGYIVHGIKRRSSSLNSARIDHLYADPHIEGTKFLLHYGDLTDATNLIRLVHERQPEEIYNLAAQRHVQ